MNKKEKNQIIDELVTRLNGNKNFYLADTSTLTGIKVNDLRRICFEKKVEMTVVKNTLLRKALEKSVHASSVESVYDTLVGNTAVLFGEQPSDPARIMKEFRVTNSKPTLKAAFVEESVYLGDEQLEVLSSLKTKNELIADIIALLQSPAKNVIGALQSGGNKLSGIVKTLGDRPE
ncbi:MAG TPA: 50S ribosomal protein L10 [Bacteroidia bacterium]|jgi:large subunit ribosomal protein L10|nr:50S ribosomal protein L10 [Bacteroidia bacterium]HWY99131.1 50S ribosomal protein L10 [Bacteroidia bacterium]